MSPTGDNTPQRLQLMQHTRNIRFIQFTHNYTYAYTELNSPILVVLICRLNYTATLATLVCLSVRLSSVTETRNAPYSERATPTSRLEAEVNVERIAKSSVERRTTKNHRRPRVPPVLSICRSRSSLASARARFVCLLTRYPSAHRPIIVRAFPLLWLSISLGQLSELPVSSSTVCVRGSGACSVGRLPVETWSQPLPLAVFRSHVPSFCTCQLSVPDPSLSLLVVCHRRVYFHKACLSESKVQRVFSTLTRSR